MKAFCSAERQRRHYPRHFLVSGAPQPNPISLAPYSPPALSGAIDMAPPRASPAKKKGATGAR